MHAVFMLYGKKECVDTFLRDLGAQKLLLRCWKEGEKDLTIWLECQIRILPGGIYEFIFPKEYMPQVLTSLNFHIKEKGQGGSLMDYDLDKEISILGMKFKPLDYVRRFLRIEEAPEFEAKEGLIWIKDNVGIIPIGVRYDPDYLETKPGTLQGWTHEAI